MASGANDVLHGWLKAELAVIVAALPPYPAVLSPEENRAVWERWQEGLSVRPTLLAELPPLRMLLVWDNLAGHKTPELVGRQFEHGIMPLYTPLGVPPQLTVIHAWGEAQFHARSRFGAAVPWDTWTRIISEEGESRKELIR